jgi:predicted dehydrogenase
MRVAFIGVSHWHAKHYYGATSRLSKHSIAGISDPGFAQLHKLAADLGTVGYADYRELLDAQRPDFVFIFGPHHQLAATARYVIERGIA